MVASSKAWFGSRKLLLNSPCCDVRSPATVVRKRTLRANHRLVIRQSALVKAPLSRKRAHVAIDPSRELFYLGDAQLDIHRRRLELLLNFNTALTDD